MTPVLSIRGLVTSQFMGSFNDNAFKLLIIVLARRAIEGEVGLDSSQQERALYERTVLTFVLFTLPHLLLFMPAGWLADRFPKRSVLVAAKIAETALLGAGALLLWAWPNDLTGPLVVLTLMGARNGLLSPAKYGVVPELVPLARLTRANGALELFTFLAIIAGAGCGPILAHLAGGVPALAALVLTGIAALGLLAAASIPRVAHRAIVRGVTAHARVGLAAVRASPHLRLGVVGASAFWVIASLLGQDFVIYAKSVLELPEQDQGLLLAMLGVGVGVGAVSVGRLSQGSIQVKWVARGAFALGLLTLAAGLLSPALPGTLFILALIGVAGGFVIVPLDSLLQWHAPTGQRGAVIAFANLFIFGGMMVGFLLGGAMSQAGMGAAHILVGAAVPTLALAAWSWRVTQTLPAHAADSEQAS